MLNDRQRETVRDYFKRNPDEEFSGILQDGDRVAQMVHEADNEVERECRAFTQKEGGAK